MPLTNIEWDFIMKDSLKRIDGNIEWVKDEYHASAQCFRAEVKSSTGYRLFVRGRYNRPAGSPSYSLILKPGGRIYGLDMGKDHHNPQFNRVGDPHKHR